MPTPAKTYTVQNNIHLGFYPEDIRDADKWDEVEVHPIGIDYENGGVHYTIDNDTDYPDYYGVYLHLSEGGIVCVADLPTQEMAQSLADLLMKAGNKFFNNKPF